MNANESKHDIEKMRKAHKVLKEFTYELKPVVKGYNDRTLYINVGTLDMKEKPVSPDMKKKFTGGKGFDLKLLWDAVSSDTRWDSPENEISIATGPIAGNTNYPGSGKSLVVTISPQTGIPIDSNVGGYFGPYLKFAGFDAMEIQGKADRTSSSTSTATRARCRSSRRRWRRSTATWSPSSCIEMFADDEQRRSSTSSVVSAGRGSEHAYIGCLNFSFCDKRRKVAAPEAGGPRRPRHRLPRQEDQGPGRQVLGPERQVQQPGRPRDAAGDRAEAAQGDHDASTTSSAECARSAPPT